VWRDPVPLFCPGRVTDDDEWEAESARLSEVTSEGRGTGVSDPTFFGRCSSPRAAGPSPFGEDSVAASAARNSPASKERAASAAVKVVGRRQGGRLAPCRRRLTAVALQTFDFIQHVIQPQAWMNCITK